DAALQGRGRAARHRRLVRLLVHRRLHTVPADLVQESAVGRSAGLRGALADHARRERHHAADADQRRWGLSDTARRRRRDDVPRAQVPQDPDRDGPLPARDARTLTLRRTLASGRTPPAHRRLDGSVAAGQEERRLRDALERNRRAGGGVVAVYCAGAITVIRWEG